MIKYLKKTSINRMNLVEIGWVAGIIEGEGSMGFARKQPNIVVSMCDFDTIERLQTITGIGKIYDFTPSETQLGDKPMKRWHVGAANDIAHLLCSIVPLLSERRRLAAAEVIERILEMQKEHREYIANQTELMSKFSSNRNYGPLKKKTCFKGHDQTSLEHAYFTPSGERHCRTCKLERQKERNG